MNLLLDTHTFVWWSSGDPQLSPDAKRAIADPSNVSFVSAATAWEIVTKFVRRGTQEFAPFAQDMRGAIRVQGFSELPLTVRHAELSARLPPHHNDPFDRMLIAQAIMESMPLVTRDPLMPPYGVVVLW